MRSATSRAGCNSPTPPTITPVLSFGTCCSVCRPKRTTNWCPGSPSPIPSLRTWALPRVRRGNATRRSACCAGLSARTTAQQAERETDGHIKVITAKNGRILGATIVGAHAGELITTWTLALSRGLNIRAMTGIVVPYPTLSEIGKRAAITYFSPSLTNPKVRRLINFLRLVRVRYIAYKAAR